MRLIPPAAVLLLLAAPAVAQDVGQRTAPPQSHLPAQDLAPGQDDLQEAIAAAAGHPLGSLENPVRVGGPEGRQAYALRLRCPGGGAPRIGEAVEAGVGAFGTVVQAVPLTCGTAVTRIIFDMYHEEHVEEGAPPGFTISPH